MECGFETEKKKKKKKGIVLACKPAWLTCLYVSNQTL